MPNKLFDSNGLLYVVQWLKSTFVAKEAGKGLSSNDYTTDEKTKLSGIEAGANNYTLPSASSTTLGGIKVGAGLEVTADGTMNATAGGTADSVEWEGVLNTPTTLSGYGIDDAYTKEELDGKISSVYKPAGNVAFAGLPTPTESVAGFVYNVTEPFTTDDRFVEGSGKTHPIGTNVVVAAISSNGSVTYMLDVLAGFVDLSDYMKTEDITIITNAEIDAILAS